MTLWAVGRPNLPSQSAIFHQLRSRTDVTDAIAATITPWGATIVVFKQSLLQLVFRSNPCPASVPHKTQIGWTIVVWLQARCSNMWSHKFSCLPLLAWRAGQYLGEDQGHKLRLREVNWSQTRNSLAKGCKGNAMVDGTHLSILRCKSCTP